MRLTRHATTLAVALLVTSFAPRLYAQVRIAVVDLQRALAETEDGRRAKAQLKRLIKARQKTLDDKQAELTKMRDDIEKQKNVLSRDALQKRMDEYQQKFVDVQTVYVEFQRELAAKEAELTKSILDRMEAILRRIGQAEGYTLVVERNEAGVMWVPGNLDITDNVIQRYNAGEGREAAPPAAPARGGAAGAGGNKATKAPGH